MSQSISRGDVNPQAEDLEVVIEDYALVRVPEDKRKGWFDLSTVIFGFATALFWFLFGGVTTFLAGFWMGLLACFISATLGFVGVLLMGNIARKEGLSCDLNSRAFGFGQRGSVLPSAIYGFMLCGFLGVESSVIGKAVLYYAGVPESLLANIILYVPMAIAWTLLTLFGIGLVVRVAQVAVPLMLIFLVVVLVIMLNGQVLGEAVSHGVMVPGIDPLTGFVLALNFGVGTSFLLGAQSADFLRYARRPADIVPYGLIGGYAAYFIVPALGGIVTYSWFGKVLEFFKASGVPEAAAAQAATASPGIGFVVAGGFIGLLLVVASQAKIQTTNCYGASLALANIFAMAFNWKPGRKWCVILANVFALAFVFGGVLEQVVEFTTLGGAIVGAWVTIMATDYYIIRGRLKLAPSRIARLENLPIVNWIGIVTWAGSVIIGMWLYNAGVFPIPFVSALVLSFIGYLVLSVATQGRFSQDQEGGLEWQPDAGS